LGAGLEAVRLDSAYSKGHVRAGRGFLDMADFFNARTQFRKALDLDGSDKAARKGMKDVDKAEAAEDEPESD
jgi:stress-induced-phosphoprotein 1